jgi:cell division protein FtsB
MSSPAVQIRSRVPRLAGSAVERARLTVVPRRRVRAARVPFVTLVSLILLGGVIGLLLFNTSMQQSAFAATALERQAGSLSAREQTLRMELDVLRDPQRVAERAQAMGMVPAVSSPFIRLSDGKVLGTPTVATPLDNLRIRPQAPALPASLNPPPLVVDPPAEPGASEPRNGRGGGRNG